VNQDAVSHCCVHISPVAGRRLVGGVVLQAWALSKRSARVESPLEAALPTDLRSPGP
jgi:hypothetical protein